MKKYIVGIKIYSSKEVEAESKEEAEKKVRAMDLSQIIADDDLAIDYVDRVYENDEFFEIEEDE